MTKPWLGYALLVILVVLAALAGLFALLWASIGNVAGALLALAMLLLAGGLLAALAGYFVSNAPAWLRRLRGIGWEDHLARLESAGAAVREHYHCHRALIFEDLATSSLVHLIDVGDGRTLCLRGQYYYDFEPITDEPEHYQPRRFPTTEFSLLRNRKTGEVLDLTPGKEVVEPTLCAALKNPKDLHPLRIQLEDGELLGNLSFEAVRQALQAGETQHIR